jgi:hypothetical protein
MLDRIVSLVVAAALRISAKRRSAVRFALVMAVALTPIFATSVAVHASLCGPSFGVCAPDGNACTIDYCRYYSATIRGYFKCEYRHRVICDDFDPCTTDTCDPADGCIYTEGTCATTTTLACSGNCGNPTMDTSSGLVTASDALYILQAAVGTRTCEPCICDVNDSGSITGTDALLAMAVTVGSPVTLTCPQ